MHRFDQNNDEGIQFYYYVTLLTYAVEQWSDNLYLSTHFSFDTVSVIL